MDLVIISRHPAAIEFIRAERPDFAQAPVLAQATAADVRGKVVAGNLPLHLAAEAALVFAVEFRGESPRGAEYTLEDMRAMGARLVPYTVRQGGRSYAERMGRQELQRLREFIGGLIDRMGPPSKMTPTQEEECDLLYGVYKTLCSEEERQSPSSFAAAIDQAVRLAPHLVRVAEGLRQQGRD